ncbi:MAG TPA: phytoene desaturase family protein [Dermatophilaceae bacterium]|nr:phytoene desaturase family protein [Dermatophilaceae bacterium]
MSSVVVIGAGLAGLSSACYLSGDGHRVIVVEPQTFPGGRSGRVHQDGFTFDTGATVLTMRDLIDDALKSVGTRVGDELELTLLDPAYRATFADGSTMLVRHGHEAMRQEIADQCGSVDAAAFDEFVVWLRRLYLAEMPNFIDRNFDSVLGLLQRPRAVASLLALNGFSRLGRQVRRRFADERLHRLFSFQAMYAGLAPSDALAIYAVITYMDSIEGVWFPRGGMRAVPDAMARAAQRAGVEFRYGSEVTDIITRSDGRVCGVELSDGEHVMADAVVCTVDLPVAYQRWLSARPAPRTVRNGSYSPSCVLWHVGVRGVPEDATHHNIHFGAAWDDAFDDLLRRGRLMRDPSRLVSVPSLDDAEAAPPGCSTLYVLEPVPNLKIGRIDWQQEAPRLRQRLLEFLGRQGYPNDILTEHLVTPQDWLAQGMAHGTPFALAHTFTQSGPFRPNNVDRSWPGLVFAGSGTVPGVGVPMVLISGKLAARRVAEYLS